MNELLNHIEKQVVLYSKGHFKRIDQIEGLKVFASELYALGEVEVYTVYHMVSNIFFKLQRENYILISLEKFIQDELFTRRTPQIDQSIMIGKMMVEIQNVKVEGLNLDEADYDLFPSLSKKEMKCPFCKSNLTIGEYRRYQTSCEHVYDPNSTPPERETNVCTCERSKFYFWDYDGGVYTCIDYTYEQYKADEKELGSLSALGSIEREIEDESKADKKKEKAKLIEFKIHQWAGVRGIGVRIKDYSISLHCNLLADFRLRKIRPMTRKIMEYIAWIYKDRRVSIIQEWDRDIVFLGFMLQIQKYKTLNKS